MKFNKWTLGLAALGVVSLASAAKADEKQNFLQTALSSTTISGYVDTSIEYTAIPGNAHALPIPFRGDSKQNGFNLNVVKLSIEKPLDESEWAAGYKVDLLFGPDAVAYNTSANVTGGSAAGLSDFAIKQAYVSLRVPIGNGLEFKLGSFDTIIGYEVFEAGNNPNFTRSWGYAVEPTEHTGLLASYRVNDIVSLSAGVANTLAPGINNRDTNNGSDVNSDYWHKTWMGSVALTAPQSWGWAAGSSLYGGVVTGFSGNTANHNDQNNYYAGITLNTPIAGLKAGAAFDYVRNLNAAGFGGAGFNQADVTVYGVYASYQATEKLSIHGRAEYIDGAADIAPDANNIQGYELTGTVQYDLWQNVVSRLEVRWDSQRDIQGISGGAISGDYVSLYANIIYKF